MTQAETKTSPYPSEWNHLARVTDIVRLAYPDSFAGIPESDREFYMERGTANHLMWQQVEEGLDMQYDERVEVYRPAHARFLRETGFRALPGCIEMRVKNEDLGYKGTIDRLGTIQNRIVLLDYKTTKPTDGTALQTALYLLAIPGYRFADVERYGVGFAKDGKYTMSSLYPLSDENDARYWAKKYQEARHDA